MSTQAQRGRKVDNKNAKTLRVFYIVLAAIAVVGVALLIIYLVRNQGAAPTGGAATGTTAQISPLNAPTGMTPEGFYYKGDPEAPVRVIEYSDYQCPACAQFHTVLAGQIDQEYVETGKIQFVFHDFPLSMHQHAVIAAEAARAAGSQGQFWQMNKLLFERQREWAGTLNPQQLFVRYAEELGLDRDQFEQALQNGTYRDQVRAAEQAAIQVGIGGTPTFMVEGRQVNAGQLVAAIESALAAKGQ